MTDLARFLPPTPYGAADGEELELTILLPCLNEAETIVTCVRKAHTFLAGSGVVGEVLVSDNGSTDGSQELARANGARVITVVERGYGAALRAGIAAARGRYVVMADADDSYDLLGLAPFLAELRRGAELVMGNRFRGGIAPGAMPALHRYLGNPALTAIGRLLFRVPIGDFHCGLRGFRRDAIVGLGLHTPGMEFASEMVVAARFGGLRITEVPTTLAVDGRSRPPHLNTWRDGWRHLRFLLRHSPTALLVYPGIAMVLCGIAGMVTGAAGSDGSGAAVRTMLFASGLLLVGYLAMALGAIAEPPRSRKRPGRRWLRVRTGLLAGGVVSVAGGITSVMSLDRPWTSHSVVAELRMAIPELTVTLMGLETVALSVALAMLAARRPAAQPPMRTLVTP